MQFLELCASSILHTGNWWHLSPEAVDSKFNFGDERAPLNITRQPNKLGVERWRVRRVLGSSLPGTLSIDCCLHSVSWLGVVAPSTFCVHAEFNSPLGTKISSKPSVYQGTSFLFNLLTMAVSQNPAFKGQWRKREREEEKEMDWGGGEKGKTG